MPASNFDILSEIGSGSKSATDFVEALKMQQMAAQRAAADRLAAQQQGYAAGSAGQRGTPSDTAFKMFMRAIKQQESGGNYGALGQYVGGDRAYGAYQIMGNNIPTWTQQALGYSLTPEQYLANKQAQNQTAKYHLWNYFKRYGPEDAARAWNQGVAGMQASPQNGADYANSVMGYMNQYGYQNPTSVGHSGVGGRGWMSPLQGALNITSDFGPRTHPINGGESFHSGIDLAAGLGSRVGAARGGTILSSGWDPIYGNQVIVQGPNGLQTMYGHLNRINQRFGVGDIIHPGQRIGQVGSTGLSSGPHLHFAASRNDQYFDPTRFLTGAPAPVQRPQNHQQGSLVPPGAPDANRIERILRGLGLSG